eukprot:UN17793
MNFLTMAFSGLSLDFDGSDFKGGVDVGSSVFFPMFESSFLLIFVGCSSLTCFSLSSELLLDDESDELSELLMLVQKCNKISAKK